MIWLKDVKHVKVFSTEVKEKFVKGQVSTSEKKQDGTWANSSWFCTFVGNCKNKAAKLNKDDKITILSGKLENVWSKERKQSYLNMTIFAFEVEGQKEEFSDFREVDSSDEIPF